MDYEWSKLRSEHWELKKCFEKAGGYFKVTGKKANTIRLMKGTRDYGYINDTVLREKGIIGYRSPERDAPGFHDACPAKKYTQAESLFSRRYKAKSGWIKNPPQPRLLNGKKVHYLIIKDLKLAKRVCEC